MNNKAQVFTTTIFWIIIVFFYVLIGLPLINSINQDLLLPLFVGNDMLTFVVNIYAFIPIIAMAFFAWNASQEQRGMI